MSGGKFQAFGQRLEKLQNSMPNVTPTATPKATPKASLKVTQKMTPNVGPVSLGFGSLIRSKHFLAGGSLGPRISESSQPHKCGVLLLGC